MAGPTKIEGRGREQILPKRLRVPWTARRSNQSILKEIFIGRNDAEAETLILWSPDVKN